MKDLKWKVTNMSWREALRELLSTNNLVTIQADEVVVHLARGYKDDEYFIIATEPDGTKPKKEKITKAVALTMLSNFFKNTRREITSAEKILDYIYML